MCVKAKKYGSLPFKMLLANVIHQSRLVKCVNDIQPSPRVICIVLLFGILLDAQPRHAETSITVFSRGPSRSDTKPRVDCVTILNLQHAVPSGQASPWPDNLSAAHVALEGL